MKYRYWYFIFSLCFLIPGFISLLIWKVQPSIDFTGGSLLEIKVTQSAKAQQLSQENLQSLVGSAYKIVSVQQSGVDQVILRGEPINNDQKNAVVKTLSSSFKSVTEERFETVGPILGKELIQKTLFAGALVVAIIIGYVWHQFHSVKYGVAAVLAMLHDALIVLGAFSLLGHFEHVEVDVLFVTALLTILSFSVHDTIIVFDRIRETVTKHPRVPYIEVVNAAVLQTMGRSINNSMTIIIMLLALVLLGGSTIHWFAFALLIGAITGTYSSTFTAAPLLLLWDELAANITVRKPRP